MNVCVLCVLMFSYEATKTNGIKSCFGQSINQINQINYISSITSSSASTSPTNGATWQLCKWNVYGSTAMH